MDDGASLSAGSHNVIVDGGTLGEGFNLGDSVKYAPTITTESLSNGNVGTLYNATLAADGTKPITWNVSSGTLPNGIILGNEGIFTGSPPLEGEYTFTVSATNDFGSDSKEYTISVGQEVTIKPVLTAGTVNRTSDSSATVTFTSNMAGDVRYKVMERIQSPSLT